MRNFLSAALACCGLAAAIAGATSPAHAIVVLDQSNDQHFGNLQYNGGSSSLTWQQGITAGRSGQLDAVDLYFWESGRIEFQLSGQSPWQAHPDYKRTISVDVGWNRVNVSDANLFVQSGQQFSVGLQGLGDTFEPTFGGTHIADNYVGGAIYLNGSEFRPDLHYDMGFRTYVDSPTANARNFGLFIGVRDQGLNPESAIFRGDMAAEGLAASFSNLPNSTGFSLVGDRIDGDGIATQSIIDAIASVRAQMSPNDTFVLYITGHGSSTEDSPLPSPVPDLDAGAGDEFVVLDSQTSNWLTDDQLTQIVFSLSDVNTVAFIDACHGGGFWGSLDPFELTDQGDLDRLSNIAMIASSTERGLAYYLNDGISIMAKALLYAWELDATGNYRGDLDRNGVMTTDELYKIIEQHPALIGQGKDSEFAYEMAYGDQVAFSSIDWRPATFQSDDFSGGIGVAGVPEPETYAMLILGFMVIGGAIRRRQAKERTLVAG